MALRLDLLADVPEAIPILEGWFVEEWAPYYGPEGPGDARSDLEACCRRDRLPVGVVARNAIGEVVGTAALKERSIDSHVHLGPWLAALIVAAPHRRQGVGGTLVAAVEREARRLGFDALYTAASCLGDLLQRRGWQMLEEDLTSLRGPIKLYRLDLRKP